MSILQIICDRDTALGGNHTGQCFMFSCLLIRCCIIFINLLIIIKQQLVTAQIHIVDIVHIIKCGYNLAVSRCHMIDCTVIICNIQVLGIL